MHITKFIACVINNTAAVIMSILKHEIIQITHVN